MCQTWWAVGRQDLGQEVYILKRLPAILSLLLWVVKLTFPSKIRLDKGNFMIAKQQCLRRLTSATDNPGFLFNKICYNQHNMAALAQSLGHSLASLPSIGCHNGIHYSAIMGFSLNFCLNQPESGPQVFLKSLVGVGRLLKDLENFLVHCFPMAAEACLGNWYRVSSLARKYGGQGGSNGPATGASMFSWCHPDKGQLTGAVM